MGRFELLEIATLASAQRVVLRRFDGFSTRKEELLMVVKEPLN